MRRIAALTAAAAAMTLVYAYLPRISCDNLPRFQVVVAGNPITDNITSFGSWCSTLEDGVTPDLLDPIPVDPGAPVLIVYETWVTWPDLTYRVWRDERVHAEGRLRHRRAFTLPKERGVYVVTIVSRWDPWWVEDQAERYTHFRVRVSGREP